MCLIVSRSWPEMCFSNILSKLGCDDSDRSIWRPKYLQQWFPVYSDKSMSVLFIQVSAWRWFLERSTATYLVLGETSWTNLVTECKSLSVGSFIPERRRAAPTFSTRVTKCRAVHCLTRVLGWLLKEVQLQILTITNMVAETADEQICPRSNLNADLTPAESKAQTLRVAVQYCTMHSNAASTACLMKLLVCPAFCSKTLTVPSSSWSIPFCKWLYRYPSVSTAKLDTTDLRLFTYIRQTVLTTTLILIIYTPNWKKQIGIPLD